MAKAADDYHRGEMDIADQKATFHSFIAASKWISLLIAASLIFLTLVFCTAASFLQAAGAAVIVLVLGILFLRSKPTDGH